MALFSLESFVSNPTLKQFDCCRKDVLCIIAAHYDIPVSKPLVKKELKSIILGGLVDRGVVLLSDPE